MVKLEVLVNVLLYIVYSLTSEAQIVSHELRRIAISSNQFGIDALKALDRIEPPDKVLVFCPVCISSSLIMIMMGSSKYQVVSALRHALYVWPLKPQEINRGYKDIFAHIGLNQQKSPNKNSLLLNPIDVAVSSKGERSFYEEGNDRLLMRHNRTRVVRDDKRLDLIVNPADDLLSLPNLIRAREIFENTFKTESGACHKWNEAKPINKSREFKGSGKITTSSSIAAKLDSGSFSNQTQLRSLLSRENIVDKSQISATSSIYMQRGLIMNYNYNLLLKQYYKTSIHPLDFIRNAEETRQHINSLAAVNTEGKITDLIKRDSFNATMQPSILIISTFHFRGTLDIQSKNKDSKTNSSRFFNKPQTKTSDQSKVSIPKFSKIYIETEETLVKYGSFPDMSCSVIEIPFNNRLVSLVFIIPLQTNSTELLLTKLNAQVFSDMIVSLKVRKLSLEIPVIKFDRGPINSTGLLRELGLDGIFFKDKPFVSETGLNKWMRPADILHETSIDFGTNNPEWEQPEDRLKPGAHDSKSLEKNQEKPKLQHNSLRLDKPFFFFVLDSINGVILTMGRIRQ